MGKIIVETQQRKAVIANFVPDEQEAILYEDRYKGVAHVPKAVKTQPIFK